MLNQVAQQKCFIEQVALWMCDVFVRVWGIVGKGCIEAGYDVDLVFVDLNKEKTIYDAE